METNQRSIEETELEIIERELQLPNRPKRKRKKVPFAVWLEQQEMKTSAEKIEQQEVSPVMENGSITQPLEVVDQKGDRPTPDSEPIVDNLVPTKTWTEEHAPADQEISAGNIEKQSESLVSGEESTAGGQEKIEIVEREQPPRTRRNKKKKIPFSVWLETHAPVDQRISSEITGTEETSLEEQESISVPQETTEKEQPLKSDSENIEKLETSLPKEGDQDNSLNKDIYTEEPAISVTQLVTEKDNISKPERKLDQKGENQSKAKPIKKTPLLWKSFPEPDASIDLSCFTENTDSNNGPLLENKSLQAASPSRGNKTVWKTLPKSEPHANINFIAGNIEMENVPMAAQKSNEEASLTTTQPKCTCAAKFKESELAHIKFRKYLMNQLDEMFDTNKKLSAKLKQQKDLLSKVLSERQQSRKPTISVQTQTDSEENLKQKPVSFQSASTQTETEEPETSSQLKPVLKTISTQTETEEPETRSQVKPVLKTISTQTETEEPETRSQVKPVLKTISTQTETEEPETRSQLKPVLKTISTQTETEEPETSFQLKPVLKTISTQTETEEPETSSQVKPVLKTISTQTETEEPETRSQLKPVLQTVSTQTEMDELETGSNWKPVCGTISTQTEVDLLESGCQLKRDNQTISTQTELQEQSSETQQDGHQDGQTKGLKRSAGKKRRESAKKAACELETVNKEKVSVENKEEKEVSMPEIIKDQRATIIIEIHKNEKVVDKLQQATEDEMVPEKQPVGDQQVEKRPLIKSKCKKRRKTALKYELENNSNPVVADQNLVQNTETPKPDIEKAAEIPQTALEEIEIKPVIVSEDVTDQDPVGLTEKLRTSPPQTEVTVNEDRIQRPQQSETQPSEEPDEENQVSEEEESPKTKISLWRRFKKFLTPSCLRQFKDGRKGQTA